MSNRKRPQQPPPKQPGMSVVPSIYCDQFEYQVHVSVVGLRLGRRNETHADVTIPLSLALEFCRQLSATVAQAVVPPQAPPAPADEHDHSPPPPNTPGARGS